MQVLVPGLDSGTRDSGTKDQGNLEIGDRAPVIRHQGLGTMDQGPGTGDQGTGTGDRSNCERCFIA